MTSESEQIRIVDNLGIMYKRELKELILAQEDLTTRRRAEMLNENREASYQVYRASCRVRQAKSKLKTTGTMYRHEQVRLQKILYENFY